INPKHAPALLQQALRHVKPNKSCRTGNQYRIAVHSSMARLPISNCIFARKLPYAPGFTSRFKAARPFYTAYKRAGLYSTMDYQIGFSASAPAFHEKDENQPTGCAYVFI